MVMWRVYIWDFKLIHLTFEITNKVAISPLKSKQLDNPSCNMNDQKLEQENSGSVSGSIYVHLIVEYNYFI